MADPIIYGPSGVALFPNWPTSGNFGNQAPGTAFSPVVGQFFLAKGHGEFLLPEAHPGVRGFIVVELLTGALGAGGTVLQLQSGPEDDTYRVRIDLNDSNRPEFAFFNGTGSAPVSWTPSGSDIAAGTLLQIRLEWSSVAAIDGDNYVKFTDFSGNLFSGSFDPDPPNTGWVFGPMRTLTLGYTSGSAFTGTVKVVQLGLLPA